MPRRMSDRLRSLCTPRPAPVTPGSTAAPGVVVAIDPGIHTGVAVFHRGALAQCELRQCDPCNLGIARIDVLVGELPVSYPANTTNHPVEPNDLITLGINLGGWIATNRAGAIVHLAPARTWKGGASKANTRERVERTLTPTERAIVMGANSSRHDVYDAIGIGLWYLGRMI